MVCQTIFKKTEIWSFRHVAFWRFFGSSLYNLFVFSNVPTDRRRKAWGRLQGSITCCFGEGFLVQSKCGWFPCRARDGLPETASVPAIVAERKGHKTRGSSSVEVGSSLDWKRIQEADFDQLGFLQKISAEKKTTWRQGKGRVPMCCTCWNKWKKVSIGSCQVEQ